MTEPLRLEIERNLAVITFNRPQVFNAFTPELIVRLASAWREVESNEQVRAVILTGAGGKAFSVGADLGILSPLVSGARAAADDWDRRFLDPATQDQAMLRNQFNLGKPIIAAINGYCFAGALELMTATDIRIASEDATFALQEAKWAMVPARGALARLPRQIPYCRAMELMLTSSRFTAAQALQMGLVNHVLPADQVMNKAREIAATIAENGPLALRRIKQGVVESAGRTLAEAYQVEDRIFAEVMASADATEGPRAFMEKRPPVYKGR
ncbi:MAG: enoyl-CoA hydratase/isomerase family protein [Candidatus Binataceae bacterium]|nr:enoyl-CoA hydratase/isomerase family protein [Candidatus Binataceae bacterium]